jgi:hypothetical protein
MAMRMTVLTLALGLATATGLAGQAIAHDGSGHRHGQGHRPPAVVVYPAYRPRRHGWHRHGYRAPRVYRPRHHHRDHGDGERWGVHLFYGRG